MTDRQLIHVVSTDAGVGEVAALRGRLGRDALALVPPTAEAKAVVTQLGATPHPEVSLSPVRFPAADRGHGLDALVRRHAVADRFRDLVVVADPATVTLLLRVLAPDQLPARGPVTAVGLPRAGRPVPPGRVAVIGGVVGLLAGLLSRVLFPLTLPGLVAVVGLGLVCVGGWRHLGLTLLLAALVGAVVALMLIAGSARFPGAW